MSNKPVASEGVILFNHVKGEYLKAIDTINTSYGRVSMMNSGLHGMGSALTGLSDMKEHLEWVAAEVAKAESLRRQLIFMYENGIDKKADEFQQELWAFYDEEEKRKKAEVA